jgi:hypothetical protein
MIWLFLLFPALLMGHNAIDFHRPGFNAPYINCLNYIVDQYAVMLEDKNKIFLVAQDVKGRESIESIDLTYDYAVQYDMNQARNLMLQLIDSFVQTLNNDARLKGILPPCGFSHDKLTITLNFTDECAHDYPATSRIKTVVFEDGFVSYYIQNPAKPSQVQILRREPIDFSVAAYTGPLSPC